MNENLFLNDLKEKMSKSIAVLENDLKGLRTGRASINLLDPVQVEAYGSKMPLNQVSTVTSPDSKTLMVQVWDKSMVKAAEKAITDANLGLSPSTDGQVIRLAIPNPTEERRRELVKLASKYGENTKISIRNIRRDGIDALKRMEKNKEIPEDLLHQISEKVQTLTNEFINKVDSNIKQKEKDILTI